MIKGIRRTQFRNAAGAVMYSYYINRDSGSPKFWGPTTTKIDLASQKALPDGFAEAYTDAKREWNDALSTVTDDMERFIDAYLESTKFNQLAPATQKNYKMYSKKIRKRFGTASIQVIEDRRFKGQILKWHETLGKSSPQSADICITVLFNILDLAQRSGELLHNPADKITRLYDGGGDKRPVTDEEHALFLARSDPSRQRIALAAYYTGLRAKDLAELTWDKIKGDSVQLYTSKSRYKRFVIIPLVEEAKAFFAAERKRQLESPRGLQMHVLLGPRGKPLTANSLSGKINGQMKELYIDRTLHNYRNAFVTLLVKKDFDPALIAGVLGWSLADVTELIRIYVLADEINAANVRKLKTNANRT